MKFPDYRVSPKSTLFREIVRVVASDPEVTRLVRPSSIRSWNDDPNDNKELSLAEAPALRFSPVGNADKFYSPDARSGDLTVNVEVVTKGLDVTDQLNLFYCVVRALYPQDRGEFQAVSNRLRAAGGFSCEIDFTEPSVQAIKEGGGGFYGNAQIRTDYVYTLNT